MQEILIVVDMQNDFIDGSLGTKEAREILPNVIKKIKQFDGKIYFTRDTHTKDYLKTREGRCLPVEHCIEGTRGHEIADELLEFVGENVIDKFSFGSDKLAFMLKEMNQKEEISKITLIGLCTDICVISNAMIIRAFLPETKIVIDASCCAGVTVKSHVTALEAMRACQIDIIND